MSTDSDSIRLDVWLYGVLKTYGGSRAQRAHARPEVRLAADACMADLLAALGLPLSEKGTTFVNGVLTDMPGLQADLERALNDGDRVGLFPTSTVWPFHYRFGAAMSTELVEAARARGGLMRHDYSDVGAREEAQP